MLKEAVIRYLGDETPTKPPEQIVRPVHKLDGWKDHEPSAIGKHIVLKLNGRVTVGCTALYKAIEQAGRMGSQGHSSQVLEARFRNIRLQDG